MTSFLRSSRARQTSSSFSVTRPYELRKSWYQHYMLTRKQQTFTQYRDSLKRSSCVFNEWDNIREFLFHKRHNFGEDQRIVLAEERYVCPFNCGRCRYRDGLSFRTFSSFCQEVCRDCQHYWNVDWMKCIFNCRRCMETLDCQSCKVCIRSKIETDITTLDTIRLQRFGNFFYKGFISFFLTDKIICRFPRIVSWQRFTFILYDIFDGDKNSLSVPPPSLIRSSLLSCLSIQESIPLKNFNHFKSLKEFYEKKFCFDLDDFCAPFLQHLHLNPVYVQRPRDVQYAAEYLDRKLRDYVRTHPRANSFSLLRFVLNSTLVFCDLLETNWRFVGPSYPYVPGRNSFSVQKLLQNVYQSFLIDIKSVQAHVNCTGQSDSFVPFYYFWNCALGHPQRFYFCNSLDQLQKIDVGNMLRAFKVFSLLFDVEKNPGPLFSIGHEIGLDASVLTTVDEIMEKLKNFLEMTCSMTSDAAKEATTKVANTIRHNIDTTVSGVMKIVVKIVKAACAFMLFMTGTTSQRALTSIMVAAEVYENYSYASENTVEYQAGEEGTENTLMFLMKALFHVGDMNFIRRHAADFRSLTFAQGLLRSTKGSIVEAIQLVIQAFKFIYHAVVGFPFDMTSNQKEMFNYITQTQKEVSDLLGLSDESFMAIGTFSYALEVCHLAQQLRSIILTHVKDYSVTGTTFLASLGLLERRINIISSAMSQEPNRRQPVTIILSGGTAVGKTTLVPVIANAVALKLDMKYITPSTVCYQHNNNQNDFFDGYRNQPFYWADEWLSTDDAETNYQEVTRWFKIANISPYPLNMADLESKGNTFFTSDFFIATTNRQRWNNAYLGKRESEEAFFRRIDICVGVQLDKSKITSDKIDPNAWSFDLYETNGKTLVQTNQEWTFDQLIDEICKKYHHYGQDKAKMNSFIAGLWQESGRTHEVEVEENLRIAMQRHGPTALSNELAALAKRLKDENRPEYQAGEQVTDYAVSYNAFKEEVSMMSYERVMTTWEKIKAGIWNYEYRTEGATLMSKVMDFLKNKWTLLAIGTLTSIVSLYFIFRKTDKEVSLHSSDRGNRQQRIALHSGETENTQRRIHLQCTEDLVDESNIKWAEKFAGTNIVLLRSLNKSKAMWSEYGLFIDDKIMVTNNHFIEGSEGLIRVLFSDGSYTSFNSNNARIARNEARDLAVVHFSVAIQGVKKITSKLLSAACLSANYGTAFVIRPTVDETFNFELKMIPPLKITNNIVGNNDIRHRLTYASKFDSEPGQCGLPYFVISNGTLFVAGIHFGMVRASGNSLMTSLMKEDFNISVEKQALMITGPTNFVCEEVPNDEAVFISRKSNLKASPYQKEVQEWAIEEGLELDRAPSIMRPSGGVDPMQVAVNKFDVPNVEDVGDFVKYLEQAVEYLAEKHQMPKNSTKELTWEEACYGVDSEERESWLREHVDSINMATAAGYDYRKIPGKGKKKLLDEDGHFNQEVMTNAFRVEANWRNNLRNDDIVAVDCLKDELRSAKKRKLCDTRIISVLPVHYNIAARKHTAAVSAWLMQHCVEWEIAVGINPHSLDWKDLYARLRKHDYAIAGDYSGFDRTIPTAIGDLFVEYLVKVTNQPEKRKLFINMVNEMQHMPHLAGNCKYYPTHGNPSGQVLTACFNSFVNMTFCLAAFLYSGRNETTPYTIDDYEEHVSITVFGDDHVISVDRSCDMFNMLTISEASRICGMKYTDNHKSAELQKFISWNDVTYLKRSFVLREEEIFAPLERSVLFDMISWVKESPSITPEEAMSARAYNAVMEHFHYGKEKMNDFRKRLNSILVEHDIPQVTLTWEYVYRAFREGSIVYDTEERFPIILCKSDWEISIPEYQEDPVFYNFRKANENECDEEKVLCTFGPTDNIMGTFDQDEWTF